MGDSDPENDTDNHSGTESDSGIQEARNAGLDGHLISSTQVLEEELPDKLQELLGRILNEEPVETLNDWTTRIRRLTDGQSIEIDDLCHSGEKTGHWGQMGDETYHFLCFYDAIILSALADQPVDIRTESPNGTVITAHAMGTTEVSVSPDTAVFSFGIDETVEPPTDEGPSAADIYAAVCPYVRAFPDQEAYEIWAKDVSATTVAMPLADATDIASSLI
ncbi:MAG: organomercurial lyase, partial [Halobacteriaceae archaeon]